MVNVWRCEICGESYIGNEVPPQCPFCGVNRRFIKSARIAKVSFDVALNENDLANVKYALAIELNNAGFYFCAARNTDDDEGKVIFKALGKVESEHASIWKKVLKLEKVDIRPENCSKRNAENLMESHTRETRAIEFYRKAAQESKDMRLKQIFAALVEVETDHLALSAQRM
jgi:rubrerythrin/rubredoxin